MVIIGLRIVSNLMLCFVIMKLAEVSCGYERKVTPAAAFIYLLLNASVPLLMEVIPHDCPFIIKLIVILLCSMGKFIVYSIIFRCIRLDLLYICFMSLITSQMYATLMLPLVPDKGLRQIAAFLAECVVTGMFVVFVKHRKCESKLQAELDTIPKLQYILIMILLYVINIFIWAAIRPERQRIARGLMLPTMFGFFFVLMLVLRTNINAHRHKEISDILSEQIEKQLEHYNKVNKIYAEFRSFRHDFKNHILCIGGLISEGENEKALEYINEIEDMATLEKREYDTGNIMVDALLSDKNAKAGTIGAKVVFEGFVPTMGISNADLCVIFSNAVDNAIEACAKGNTDIDKIITIHSDFRQGCYFIKFENPVFEEVNFGGKNKLITSKSDKEHHGFGVANILNTVDKYAGNTDIGVKDGEFCLDISLFLKKKENVEMRNNNMEIGA